MKNSPSAVFAFVVILSLTTLAFCKKSGPNDPANNPFSNGSKERNLIVVISDMHLGADSTYTECKENLGALEKLLTQIKAAPNVKELVIAGDLLDEWFVPATLNTYQGRDQAHFVQRIAATNKDVIDAINSIIQEEKILVTYLPGNHDLTITAENVDLILPAINQARDPEQGLGTYSPAGQPQIAIEHGHRYNFFCAPDPYSNQDIAPGTITPPGYFFTRLAALYFLQGKPPAGDTLSVVTQNSSGGDSQNLLFAYWRVWNWAINLFTLQNRFDEKIIVTHVDRFADTISVNDLVPFQAATGGVIDVNLFKGIQETWNQRQAHNRVAVHIPVERAIAGSASVTESGEQAKIQYFLNPESEVRIVVFGHTHVPIMESSQNHLQQKSIYANSGTWIDHNTLSPTNRNFVVITPQNEEASSQTFVRLYNFENEVVTLMAEDSLRL